MADVDAPFCENGGMLGETLLGSRTGHEEKRACNQPASWAEPSLSIRHAVLIAFCTAAATLLACGAVWRANSRAQPMPMLEKKPAKLDDSSSDFSAMKWEPMAPMAPMKPMNFKPMAPLSFKPMAPLSFAPIAPMAPWKPFKEMKPMKPMAPMSFAPMPPFSPFFDDGIMHSSGKNYKDSSSPHPSHASYSKKNSLPDDREYGPPTERPEFSHPLTFEPVPSAPRVITNSSGVCAWTSYRLPDNVFPVAYNLTIELSSLQPPALVYGKVAIDLRRKMSLPAPRCLIFHVAPEMSIDGLAVCSSETSCVPLRVAHYDSEWAQMQVELQAELPAAARLHVRFSYPLRDKLTGLYHSRFIGVDGRDHSIATTQHEATSARETFPCWDEPGYKATFKISLIIQDDNATVALSNMPALGWYPLEVSDRIDESLRRGRPLIAETDIALANASGVSLANVVAPAALRCIEFDTSPMMSTYLVAFSIGEFEAIETRSKTGVMLRAWAPAATQEVNKLRFALQVAKEALETYEELLQVPFPLPKIDIVSIPDFGPGAMENWGLITYRATNVLADDFSAPHDRQAVACTVVHELGHQWTGNLVTMYWWDELWLNEGFANYFEQAVTNLVEPKLQILKQHVQYLSRALHFDGSPDTHPVRAKGEVNSDSGVSSLFDAISYDKAGAVIFMLHDFLERKQPGAFLTGLQTYLQQHAFGSASGSDMWAHMAKATGLPIGDWVEPWFSQAGYPLIEVTTLSDGSAVLLQTGRYMQDLTRTQMAFEGQAGGDQADYTVSWWVPISYYTSTSEEVFVGEIASSGSFFSVPPTRKKGGGFDIDGSDWLKVNFNGAGYYRVNYAPHLWARLVQAATEPGRISDADLANLIDDAFALTLDGRLSGVTLTLARALGTRTAHEAAFVTSSYESWQSMSIGLHLIHSLISSAALSGSTSAGLIAGPGLDLVPRRCVEDLRRFVRTQVIGRCLDPLLAMPPSGVLSARGWHGATPAPELNIEARTIHSQLEALAPPVLLSLASTMGDVRVGVWVMHAFQECMRTPDEECHAIEEIPPDLRFQCLAICSSFDLSGRCWQLMRSQLKYADHDPSYTSALLVALARAPTEELLNTTIALTVNGTIARPQDIGSMIAMLANNPAVPRARTIVWEYAKANVVALSTGGGGGGSFGFSSVLSNVASGFASEEMAQDVQIFLALNPNLNVPDRIMRAVVGKIRSQAIWVETYGADTCAVLASWHA